MEASRPATLTMRDDSHAISKSGSKPKIRVVHIFAPEIIKTEPGNFRELVQRLTGKPDQKRVGGKKKAKTANIAGDLWRGERVKAELEEGGRLWETSGGFLSGLGDVDGFFQGLTDFQPLLPLSSHMDFIGGAHVA